jgi:hypothetical protein
MTDGSINSKKFNMSPGSRLLVGEYKKTIIVIVGGACAGKSTLSEVLINDSLNYISTDSACLQTDHGIQQILDYVESRDKTRVIDIGILGIKISEWCPTAFVDYFFKKYVEDNENLNILVEGHLFTLPDMYSYFIKKCEACGYRVWRMRRIL